MRLDIEGKHMRLAPHLMGWIAERLEDLNTPYDDICEARITFVQQGRRDAVCIELLLAGKSLHVTRRGATPDAAVAQAPAEAPAPAQAGASQADAGDAEARPDAPEAGDDT